MYRGTGSTRGSENAHKLAQLPRDRYSFVSKILPATIAESRFCEPSLDEFTVKSNVFNILPVMIRKNRVVSLPSSLGL
jgi:hypothetical protein